MLEATNKNIDIHEYWLIFWRRKYFFFVPFILALILGVVINLVTKPVYQSSTVVRVKQSQLLSGAMRNLVPGVTPQERLSNLRRLITSHAYLKRMVETLNLYNDPKMRAEAEKEKDQYPDLTINEIIESLCIEQLKKLLVIRQIGTDFIEIIAFGNTPEIAFTIAKTLTQIFIDESLRSEVGGIRGALKFSTEQLSIYKKKLEKSEEKLRKYQENIVHDNFKNHPIVSANMDQVNTMLTATDYELGEAKNRLYFLKSQMNNLSVNYRLSNNKSLNSLKTQLLAAILQLSELMLKYTWQDVKIMKINSEIENLRGKIKREIETEINSKYQMGNGTKLDIVVQKEITAIDVEFLTRKKAELSNLVKVYERRISKGPSRELTLNRLQREVEANRQIYQSFVQQTQGSEIEAALQRNAAEFKYKIIEPAKKSQEPIAPNQIKIILMACLVGLIIGGGLIFLLEYTDHSFKNIEDVEKYLNLPILCTMPKIEKQTINKF